MATRIFDLLDDYGIEYERFGISIVVASRYYESIKENFPARPPFDLGFVQMKIQEQGISLNEPIDHRGWSVTVDPRLTPTSLSLDNEGANS